MNFAQIAASIKQYTGGNLWVMQIFVVVLLTLLASFIQKRIVHRLYRTTKKTKSIWDDTVLKALQKPLTLLLWVIGLSFALEILRHESKAAIFSAITPLRDIGVIFACIWFLVRLIKYGQHNFIRYKEAEGEEIDLSTADAIAKLFRLTVIITGFLVALQTLGFSISGLLAFGGIGGIAIGFAAKDLLANFFGGLMIYLDRPFSEGDWIRSPDRDIEGYVEKIGWRLTRIRRFDKRPLYIPNATFATISVENPSRMSHRRIRETIGIRYDDINKMEGILADTKKMLAQHKNIDPSQTIYANFNSFAPSSLDFIVSSYTRSTDRIEYLAVKQDILLQIAKIIRNHGAEIAFPTSVVQIQNPEAAS